MSAEDVHGGKPAEKPNVNTPQPRPPAAPAHGTAAQGTAAQGTAAQGTAAQGTAAQGTAAQGTAAQGTAAQGTAAQGTAAQAGSPQARARVEPDLAAFQGAPVSGAKPKNPATCKQKVYLTIYLFLWVVILLPTIWCIINRLNATAIAEASIAWEMPAGATLNAGPAAFRYDASQKKLVHYGAITAERKLELRALFTPVTAPATTKPGKAPADAERGAPAITTKPPAETPPGPAEAAAPESDAAVVSRMEALRRGYNEAIDSLAYLANVRQRDVMSLLLILGALGGILGAVLRSLVDFVGHACYTEALDLIVWWPLYATRPVVGAILGFVIVVLFKAQILTAADSQSGSESFWWLGVAIIGGFSTVDVTLRLRHAAKALFGSGEKNG